MFRISDITHRFSERLGFAPKRSEESKSSKCIWFHAASVGEVNTLKPLVEELQKSTPVLNIAVSTNTKAGRGTAESSFPQSTIFYLPFDSSLFVGNALRRIKPDLLVLVEQEIWPNLILSAKKYNVPVIIINGRITDRSLHRYVNLLQKLPYNRIIRKVIGSLDKVCVQNNSYAERFGLIGVSPSKIFVTGNMKYDIGRNSKCQNPNDKYPTSDYRELFGIGNTTFVIVAGSTHPPEEEFLLETYQKLIVSHTQEIKLIIAPRHLERLNEVEHLIARHGFNSYKRSGLNGSTTPSKNSVIILDTFGELDKVYAIASVVFVGGTVAKRGGHNLIEPASLGKPIFAGGSLHNFQDIADELIAVGAAKIVKSSGELSENISALISQPDKLSAVGQAGVFIVEKGSGAAKRNAVVIREMLYNSLQT